MKKNSCQLYWRTDPGGVVRLVCDGPDGRSCQFCRAFQKYAASRSRIMLPPNAIESCHRQCGDMHNLIHAEGVWEC